MDESSITQNRRSRRSNVFLAALIEVGGKEIPVKLRNLSEDGALVEGEKLPIEGTEVVFRRNELEIRSRIAWVHANHAGVAFGMALRPEEVLRNIPKPRPRQSFDYRRPGLACRELSHEERKLVERWMTAAVNQNKVGD